MMAGLSTRRATPHDTPLLRRLFNTSRRLAGCFPGGDIGLHDFERLIEGEDIHVAEVEGVPIGFVAIWPHERFVHHLYVEPGFQALGVGRTLLRMCEERYGLPLSLKCQVANEAARAFYVRLGWEAGETGSGADGPWERLWLRRGSLDALGPPA
jgi:GNAT superfamily N-acetyltransferase